MDDAIKINVSYNHSEISLYTTAIVHNDVSGLLEKHLCIKMTLAMDRGVSHLKKD